MVNSVEISCAITFICFCISLTFAIIYLNNIQNNNHFGEGALYMLMITILACIINGGIRNDQKAQRARNVKITPLVEV